MMSNLTSISIHISVDLLKEDFDFTKENVKRIDLKWV